jgi:enoyl-CoA hydratase/carnithine racemase
MTATPPSLLLNRDGTVGTLTLNRPAARNGLSIELIGRITAAVGAFGAEPGIRAIVITANGPAFSAGHDLKEMTAHRADPDRGRAFYTDAMAACSAMMQAIVASPKPVIAAVEGVASAAGLQLVASCDLAIAASTAKFCTPGVNIGLFCSTPMVALSRNVGRKHAMEMLLLGDMIGAEDALRFGLVNRVVEPGQALPAALRLGWQIASKSAATVATGKVAFYRQAEMSLADAYAYASDVMVENMLARDAEEGIGAFIEKREPKWDGQ